MQMVCPPLPAPEGKQTNCWRLVVVLYILQEIINLIQAFSIENFAYIVNFIINIVVYVAYFWHTQYIVIEVSGEMIEIKGGPCRWCEAWTKENKPLKWISPFFCTSTQIRKDEVVSVAKHTKQYIPDFFPRFFCTPVYWCWCYKSYAAFFFPFCCVMNIAGQCEGDAPTNEMVEIVINHKKWTINIWSLCYYDKIAVAYKDESIFDQFRSNGYPLQTADATQTAPATGQTAPGTN